MNLGRYYLNSIIVATGVTLSVVFLSALAGFSFSKHRFIGRKFLFILVLATMMVPFQVTMIPIYILVTRLKLHNSYLGLILPNLVTAFGIFMMRQFMSTIPDDLVDAARIDGIISPSSGTGIHFYGRLS